MVIVGIAGKAGSGFDSLIPEIFAADGFSILKSDDAVDEVWRLPEVIRRIASAFGRDEVFENTDNPDPQKWHRKRGVLGQIVSEDPVRQAQLNAILEPYMFLKIYESLTRSTAAGGDKLAVISPRLAHNCYLFCNFTLYIRRDDDQRRKEILKFYRDRGFDQTYTMAKVDHVMTMQRDVIEPPDFAYDFVLNRDEDEVSFRTQIRSILDCILFELRTVDRSLPVLQGYRRRGQFTRTALSLSEVNNQPVVIRNATGLGKKNAVRVSSLEICIRTCAAFFGGSLQLSALDIAYQPAQKKTETPQVITVPQGASVSPIIQTLLPTLVKGTASLDLTFKGSTELEHSAPADYFTHVFFPVLRNSGFDVSIDVKARGFMEGPPGLIKVQVNQSRAFRPLTLTEKGEPRKVIFSRQSTGRTNVPANDVAARILSIAKAFGFKGEFVVVASPDTVASESPRCLSMSVAVETETGFLGTDIACDRVTSREHEEALVARFANDVKALFRTDAAVDHFCADQILIFLALVGGRVRVPIFDGMDHFYTQVFLINQITGKTLHLERSGPTILVTCDSGIWSSQ